MNRLRVRSRSTAHLFSRATPTIIADSRVVIMMCDLVANVAVDECGECVCVVDAATAAAASGPYSGNIPPFLCTFAALTN